jgi:electron transfer flavoprotein alpha subunit
MKNIAIFIDFKENEVSSYSSALLDFAHSILHKDITYHLFSFDAPSNASIPNLNAEIKGYKFESTDQTLFGQSKELDNLISILKNAQIDEVWCSKSNKSDTIASLISAKMEFQVVPNIKKMELTGTTYSIQKSIFSGKAIAHLKLNASKFIAIFPKGFSSEVKSETNSMEISFDSIPLGSKADYQVGDIENHEGSIPLPEASIVVGAGRGMKEASNWGIIEDLAQSLHAATACSKPVSDINWRPHHEHVGQTGIKIAPKLYIACGISGAIQHLAGVNGSGKIVVINQDPEAPFFKHADYGIVGDLFDVVPRLTKIIKEM